MPERLEASIPMHRTFVLIACWLAAAAACGSVRAAASPQAAAPAAAVPAAPRALLDRYCVTCHNDAGQRRGNVPVSLQAVDTADVGADAALWESVLRKLRAGMMPPAGRPRPDRAAHDRLLAWLEGELDRAADARPNPGRTETFHRLNRTEYANVVRDLLALDVDAAALLPADDASYGFDNIAGVLRLNQSLMERYLAAAAKISRAAVGRPLAAPTAHEFRIPEERRQYERVAGLPFGTRGGALIRHTFPQDGDYVIDVDLLCRIAGECDGSAGFADRHELVVTVDGARVGLFALEPHEGVGVEPRDLQVRVAVEAGPREIGVAFLKLPSAVEVESLRQRFFRPYYLNGNSMQQRWAIYQPFVDRITITGPFTPGTPGATPSRARIFTCRPAAGADESLCARTILAGLARRAYRRPVADDDVDRLLTFFEAGRAEGSFDAGIELALSRLLTSPEFLFRIERDPSGAAPGTNYPVSDLELASRLSFFLWSSLPDDELLGVAARGELRDPPVLARQVRRLLADRRSRALVDNFAGQWLQLRNLEAAHPAVPLFPDFDDSLRQAFRRETELLVASILREDRSVLELLTADYTFVNERLALHYGLPGVRGSHFRRVTLRGTARRGLLGHGSILTVTSRPNRTSPVLRGKWILENILGAPPPAPPPDVPPLPGDEEGAAAAPQTMRGRMAAHRANPACAGCHAMIDPPGFALENFDAVGRWREVDESFRPLDASGRLPDGAAFADLAEFRALLLARPAQFVTTVVEKLLTYALGRGVEAHDLPGVRRIVREAAATDYRLPALIEGITRHEAFLMRRAASPAVEAE